LWASRGIDGWYLGLSLDHYWCDVYYVPETRACRVLGSTQLFWQHCQLPTLTPHQHLRAITEKLAAKGTIAGAMTKGHCLLKLLQKHIGNILTPPPPILDQGTEQSSEVVLCPILYCRDIFSTYLGKILDFVVVHWSFIFVSHVSRLIVEFI
jgi:hypothetical protein